MPIPSHPIPSYPQRCRVSSDRIPIPGSAVRLRKMAQHKKNNGDGDGEQDVRGQFESNDGGVNNAMRVPVPVPVPVPAPVPVVEDSDSFRRQREVLSCVPDYMPCQPHIDERMRAALVDWLFQAHQKFDLLSQTLFKTINLIDRFLSKRKVKKWTLQVVGVTAMFMACKYEEKRVLDLQQLTHISHFGYTRQHILQMEDEMMDALQFNLTVPTPYTFMASFLSAAQSNTDTHNHTNTDLEMEMLCVFLLQSCLREYEMLKYPPSMVAAAAVYTARWVLRRVPYWNTTLHHITTYTKNQLKECVKLMGHLS